MEINQCKIVKGKTLAVTFTTTDADGNEAKHQVEYQSPIHPDLRNAFKELEIHFGLITEWIDKKDVPDIENFDPALVEKYHVTSFSIGGKEDDPGITITGYRIQSTGKAFPMNAPFQLFNEPESSASAYKYVDHLEGVLMRLNIEVEKYLDGKHEEDAQQELEFPDEPVTHAVIAEPEAKPLFKDQADTEAMQRVAEWDHEQEASQPKKKGRPKKVAQSAEVPSGIVEE